VAVFERVNKPSVPPADVSCHLWSKSEFSIFLELTR